MACCRRLLLLRLARDVVLVVAFPVTVLATALMVGSVAGTGDDVVLHSAVGAEDVLRSLDVQIFERLGLGDADLYV